MPDARIAVQNIVKPVLSPGSALKDKRYPAGRGRHVPFLPNEGSLQHDFLCIGRLAARFL